MKLFPHVVIALIMLAFFPTSSIVNAEVTGYDPLGKGGLTGSYPIILGLINDDADPTGFIWTRYHADNEIYTVLNDQGAVNGDGRPSITMDASGLQPVVFWARKVGDQFDVVYSTMQDGQWIAPVSVSADPALDELDPNILFDPVGQTFHLFYWTAEIVPAVWHRTAPADLSSWSAAVPVSSPSESSIHPAAVMHDGELYVSYEVHTQGSGQTPREIVLSKYENDNFVPQVVAITQHDGDVSPIPHSERGRFWVDWIDSPTEGAWTERDPATGLWNPIGYQPYADSGDRDYHLRGAIEDRIMP